MSLAHFSSKAEVAAYVCSHVFEHTRPVLLVMREDEDWQFLCGKAHPGELPRVVGMNHLLDDDPSLHQLVDLPTNWEAERKSSVDPWIRSPSQPER
jgi:hypothetical protein